MGQVAPNERLEDQILNSRSKSKGSNVGAQAIVALETSAVIHLPQPKLPPSSVVAHNLPPPSRERLLESLGETAFESGQLLKAVSSSAHKPPGTVLYLAYGSNLCAQTFQGKRGIKPISNINVLVPKLVLTFDLPGIPYIEPCFGNTRYRDDTGRDANQFEHCEKVPLLNTQRPPKYHKNRWHKGLVGVVYEVTMKDYAHIIATEGGGATYHDVVVDCYPLPPSETVPEYPKTLPFKAHTLFAPALPAPPPGHPPSKSSGRIQRPDTSYAQPSPRYLKLITDGAMEHHLPTEYMDYLYQLRPYKATRNKQRLGRFVIMLFWFPILMLVFTVASMVPNKDGRAPPWLAKLTGALFRAIWASYDRLFNGLFGDGERTVYQDEDQEKNIDEKREDASQLGLTDRRNSLDRRTIFRAV
ncbi:MAG: hypothetical protein M1812_005766 [Candelaria pacifica]|nr:MAG: hypothetical protein M1812_005766 [Candelaria pacifica]